MDRRQYESLTKGLGSDFTITRDTINQCMMNQAEKYVDYALAYQQAVKRCKLLEIGVEQAEASIDRWLSGTHAKVTEKMVRTACWNRDSYRQLKQELIEAEDIRDSLESIVRAMEHRRDMLINYGATVREEERLTSGGYHVNKERSR